MKSIRINNLSKLMLRLLAPLLVLSFGTITLAENDDSVIIGCDADCSAVIADVLARGGTISYEYDNVNAIVARVPNGAGMALASGQGVSIAYKDAMIASPRPTESAAVSIAPGTRPIVGDELNAILEDQPADYYFNNGLIGASTLHDDGFSGDDVVVAVIDSGTANNADVVPAIAGDVIGGENFVPGASEPSATSTLNGDHGTWVATQISANVAFLFSTTGTLAQSLLMHAPDSVVLDFPFPGAAFVPMIGVAPEADIYAMKVFPASGGGAPESRIIAAMDRAITLRRNYNNGMPSVPVSGDGSEDNPYVYNSLNIQVVNMSLGGPTLFAGRDLEDQLTSKMLEVGITLVASAGNEGHAAMTGGSAGTGIGSLTSGAMSTAAHERVLRDVQFGLGAGNFYRPTDHAQMASFSSRGPSADGRISTDAVSSGFATLAQGAAGGINLVSGTSFSAPQMSGAAALLREAVPGASAVQVRNALKDYADPGMLGDGSAPIDQGQGVIDIPASLAALQAGGVRSDLDMGLANKSVRKNIESLGFKVLNIEDDAKTLHLADLRPGQVEHIFVRSHKKTKSFTISLTNIEPELPTSDQNQFFGDDLFVKVQDAITSDEATLAGGFYATDTTVTVDQPQTGVVRIAVMGDWTNAGRISADLTIAEDRGDEDDDTAEGKIEQGATEVIFVDIPAGTGQATFDLRWNNNWGAYPTDDLDLILIDPSGAAIFDGATLSSPERVVVASPAPGPWIALIDGFTIHGVINKKPYSRWDMTVKADGEVLKETEFDD